MNMSDYLALFPGASREKPKLMALARAVLRQAMDLVPLTEQLLSGFPLPWRKESSWTPWRPPPAWPGRI